MLADGFFKYLPWFNAAWLLGIALNIILMRRGRWDVSTRLASIGLSLFNIGICGSILTTGPQKLFIISSLESAGMPPEASQILTAMAGIGLIVLFSLIIILEVIKIAQTLLRMFKK
jgi:hypothetical protein